MPELPEVETTLRGLLPLILQQRILALNVRERRLRWPVPDGLEARLSGQRIQQLTRRAKYLLIGLDTGALLVHLGMSGSLRVLPSAIPAARHEHWDLLLEHGQCLRLRDPRRFSALLWADAPVTAHPLLRHLGPEPFDPTFDAAYLIRTAAQRRIPVKSFIMDQQVVVGVGNIYASESLFHAGIHPARRCTQVGSDEYTRLVTVIRQVLIHAIEKGGTSLRDFQQADGHPGYFASALQVYGRSGAPCLKCATPIHSCRLGQRSSFFCPTCQR